MTNLELIITAAQGTLNPEQYDIFEQFDEDTLERLCNRIVNIKEGNYQLT